MDVKVVDPVPAFICSVKPVSGEPPSAGIIQSTVIEVDDAVFLVGAEGVMGIVAEMIETRVDCGPSPTMFTAVILYWKVAPLGCADTSCIYTRVLISVTASM